MELDWFKRIPTSYTVLVYGEMFDDRPPLTNNILFGQKAYEAYCAYAYLESLLQTRNHPTYVDWTPLFCAVYAGIIASSAEAVTEIGSTLFATIDKIDKLARLSGGPAVDLTFVGIEPSELFCQTAEALHPGRKIQHYKKLADAPAFRSVSRSYQSTSYCFDTTRELVDYCASSIFGSHGLWCSTDGTTRNAAILGKSHTLFSIPEFVAGMHEQGYKVRFHAASKASRLDHFDYYETWLIYHKFTTQQEEAFHEWLRRLTAITNEQCSFYENFADIPLGLRKDQAFEGLDPSGVLNFTSGEALRRFSEWKGDLRKPDLLKRVSSYLRRRL